MSEMGDRQSGDRAGKRQLVVIAGLVGFVLLVVAAVVLLVDPFGWHLLDKVSGLRDEAAGAAPADTALYVELDLITFSEERLTEFSQPFVAALAEPGVADLGGGLARLDEMLAAEFGLTLGDDVMPWLGRSVGLGLTDLTLAPDGGIESAGWLLVAGSQDRAAADAFLEKLAGRATAMSGVQPLESRYQGRDITSFELASTDLALDGLAFSRSAGQVIIGSDIETVQAAIDAQKGQSLADETSYQALLATLPEERGLTLYADQARLPQLSRLAGNLAPLAIGPLDLTQLNLPPLAMGVSIVEQGLRLDTASPVTDGPVADESAASVAPGPRHMAGLFPAETLLYLTGDSLAGVWDSFKGSLAAGGNLADFEESMALFSREFGFDPDRELLPVLDGEWTLGLLPAGEGLLADLSGLPLGMVLLASGEDQPAMSEALASLNRGLEGQRLPLETVDLAGTTAYFIDLESLLGAPLPYYGLDGDTLYLGTAAADLELVLSADTSLGGESDHEGVVALLPDGYETGAYIDVARLLALLDDGSGARSLDLLAPIARIISGTGAAEKSVSRGITFIVIE